MGWKRVGSGSVSRLWGDINTKTVEGLGAKKAGASLERNSIHVQYDKTEGNMKMDGQI